MKYRLSFCVAILLVVGCTDENKSNNHSANDKQNPRVVALQQNISKYPDSVLLRLQLVDVLDSAALYKEAIQQMDTLIMGDSLNNMYWFKMGQLFENLKDTAKAIKSYNRSINVYPSVEAQLYLANLLAEKRDPISLQLVNRISKLMPDNRTNAECDFIAGVYHARVGNKQQAMMLFDRCIVQDVKFTEAYVEKGQLLLEAKKMNEALKVFEAMAAANQTSADAYYYLGKCYELMNNLPLAINNYEKSLTFDANLVEAQDALNRLKK